MKLLKEDLQVDLQTENDLYVHMDNVIKNTVNIKFENIEEIFMYWACQKRNKKTDVDFGTFCSQRNLHLIKLLL
jgi:hypothetical protein